MSALSRFGVVALLGFAAAAHADLFYKSVLPGGAIEYSDKPPEDGRAVLAMVNGGAIVRPDEERARGLDDAVARASALLDTAEHALALARDSRSAPPDPLRFGERRFTPPEAARVAYCKKRVLDARRDLFDAVKRQRAAQAQVLASS